MNDWLELSTTLSENNPIKATVDVNATALVPILSAKEVNLHIRSSDFHALKNISFSISQGEKIGFVGESGSGKSLLTMVVAALLDHSENYELSGSLLFQTDGHQVSVLTDGEKKLQKYRQNNIGIIFQDPYASLNPTFTCGRQIADIFKLKNQKKSKEHIYELLQEVGFSDPKRMYSAYPFELSGGECQRMVIASVMASEPDIIIADEPTSSLDIETEQQIMQTLIKTIDQLKATFLFISHDLGLIKKYTQKLFVLDHGKIVGEGLYADLEQASNASFRRLFVQQKKKWSDDIMANTLEILQIKNLSISYASDSISFLGSTKKIQPVKDVSFSIRQGEILGLVGRSGSGKSSIARAIARLIPIESGEIYFRNKAIHTIEPYVSSPVREKIQLILQDNYNSFNPIYTVRRMLLQVGKNWGHGSAEMESTIIPSLFEQVHLPLRLLDLYPQHLSGGQRQRLLLARALIVKPEVLICDESVAALDVHIRYALLDLLDHLRRHQKLSILFISHDMVSVRYLCDRMIRITDEKTLVEEQL